jgi:hypothetical protein
MGEELPLPELEVVLAHLRAGHRVTAVGSGGRWHETFFFANGRLCMEVFDEGLTYERVASEDDLRKAIGYHPDDFRRALTEAGRTGDR